MLTLARMLDYSGPNSFESELQKISSMFMSRIGVCYEKSRIVNIPCNKVQEEVPNRSGSIHQDHLLEKWDQNFQMDYRKLYGFANDSVHQEIDFDFIERQSKPVPKNALEDTTHS